MDRHPLTGVEFASPVPPGTGWPGDPAKADTPIARTPAAVRRLAASAGSVAEVDERLTMCRACPRLVCWREAVATVDRRASFADQPYWGRPVPSFGPVDAPRLLVGLAPAANGANRTGRMFTGDRSGDWLFAALYRAGYASQPESTDAGDGMRLTGIRLVAPVRCAPPANKPTGAEKAHCAPWLDRDLALTGAGLSSILALGAIGWTAALTAAEGVGWVVPRPRPRFGHGVEVELIGPAGDPIRLLGCYHVSPLNTSTGRLTEKMLDEVIARL